MRVRLVTTSSQVLTWCCVVVLAVLSLLPAEGLATLSLLPAMKIVRTVLSARLEHFVAYAGVAAIVMAGFGSSRGGVQIIWGLSAYAGILECVRHFSPGRHPSVENFAGSTLGVLCGGLNILLLWRRPSDQPR